MKRCFKCLCEKPLEDFYAHAKMADGRLNKCKDCTKKDVIQHRLENLERIRAYDRMRGSMPHRIAARAEYRTTDAYAESHSAAVRRWETKFPERKRASSAVSSALRSGKLKRSPCMLCGEKAQAHHPDYSTPLLVVWLCPKHHAESHALTTALERNVQT